MTRVLTCGFELGDITLEIPTITTPTADHIFSTTTGRRPTGGPTLGTYAAFFNNQTASSTQYGEWPLTAISEGYFRFGIADAGSAAFRGNFIYLLDGSNNAVLTINNGPGMSIIITAGQSSTTAIGTVTSPTIGSTWVLMEFWFKQATSGGRFVLKMDGVTVLDFTGNTDPDSRTTFSKFRLAQQCNPGQVTHTIYDDLAINNTSGGVDDSWIGDGYVIAALKPSGNGTANQWTNNAGNSTNNYSKVNTLPPGTSTFVQDAVSGDEDDYTHDVFPTGLIAAYTISRVWLSIYGLRINAGVSEGVLLQLLIGGTYYADANGNTALAANAAIYNSAAWLVDPSDSAAWTSTKVNNAQIAQKVP